MNGMNIKMLVVTLAAAMLVGVAPARADDGGESEVECVYDKGVYFQRKGGAQSLKIYGYMQALWTGAFNARELETNEFRVRRGRLLASGAMNRDLDFKLHVDFAASKPLLDYYVDYRPWEAFGIRLGQYKTPLGRQFLASASKKQFVDDTIATAEFKLDRDIGVMLHGAVEEGLFGYQIGVFNGAGKNALQDNTDFMYVARFELAPFGPVPFAESDVRCTCQPRLSIALASAFNTVEAHASDDGTRRSRYTMGGEVALFWKGLYAASEVFWRIEDPRSGASTAGLGGYVQAGYMVLPEHLEFGARGALVRENMDEIGDDRWEVGPVINGFFHGHRLKVQLDYAALIDENPLGADALDHRVRLQLQAVF